MSLNKLGDNNKEWRSTKRLVSSSQRCLNARQCTPIPGSQHRAWEWWRWQKRTLGNCLLFLRSQDWRQLSIIVTTVPLHYSNNTDTFSYLYFWLFYIVGLLGSFLKVKIFVIIFEIGKNNFVFLNKK